jgi:cis-L-3-hydroxyproline dehydratase
LRILSIAGYRLDQPFRDGPYVCSGGRSALGFDSLVARIETDAGITGWGEMAPLGAFYDPAFAAGARGAFAELAPALIGDDPAQLVAIDRRMDFLLKGHPYAKSAIDMACWDILGKAAGLPLAELLGGRFGHQVDLYRSVSQDRPEKMAARAKAYVAEGYRRLQVKVGLDPDEDIERFARRSVATSSYLPTPTAAGSPIRRAGSCARPASSTITWNSLAPLMPSAAR